MPRPSTRVFTAAERRLVLFAGAEQPRRLEPESTPRLNPTTRTDIRAEVEANLSLRHRSSKEMQQRLQNAYLKKLTRFDALQLRAVRDELTADGKTFRQPDDDRQFPNAEAVKLLDLAIAAKRFPESQLGVADIESILAVEKRFTLTFIERDGKLTVDRASAPDLRTLQDRLTDAQSSGNALLTVETRRVLRRAEVDAYDEPIRRAQDQGGREGRRGQRREEESRDRAKEAQSLSQLERGMATGEDPEKAREALRRQWLADVAGELEVAWDELTLGRPDSRIRTRAEQYGISVGGKHLGDVYAGYEKGRTVEDKSKYVHDEGGKWFTEAGFKSQVRALMKEARAQD